MTMRPHQRGFSLIELMIALAIVFLLLGVVTAFFIKIVSGYKTQTKLTESNLESNLGLEILRKDIASAGYGLPWSNVSTASESIANTSLSDTGSVAPRAVASINNANAPDILTIKSMSVTDQAAGRRFMIMNLDNNGALRARTLNDQNDDFDNTNRVIVVQPGGDITTRRWLISGGTQFSNASTSFAPATLADIRLVYGVTNSTDLRMPFNRADYWIDNTNVTVPRRCAPGTGVLVKGVVSHDNGAYNPVLPLLDCVKDMQVSYSYIDNAGSLSPTDEISEVGTTAAALRESLREVRVFVLAQEGMRDSSYTHGETSIYVGDAGLGHSNTISGDALHYRWRVHRFFVAPDGLGN